MSCLTIIQDAAEEVGVDQPQSVVGNADPNVRLLFRFANKAGENIGKRHDWSRMITQHTFTSVAAEPQPDAFPAGFDRMSYMSDVWDRSRNLRYLGPQNVRDWQYLQHAATAGASGIIGYWRIIGGVLNLFPAPPAGDTIALEYIGTAWAIDQTGATPRTSGRFEADGDIARFPERLILNEVVWRWKQRQGLDYAEAMSDAERVLEVEASRDRGINIMAIGGSRVDNTQAVTWPGTVLP